MNDTLSLAGDCKSAKVYYLFLFFLLFFCCCFIAIIYAINNGLNIANDCNNYLTLKTS